MDAQTNDEKPQSRREIILDTVDDLVADFLHYDRKEDEELERGEIEDAIDDKEITADEIVARFREKLEAALAYEES